MEKVKDLTPTNMHRVSTTYEILTTKEESAIKEVKKIFEINKDLKSITIRLTLWKN